MHLAYLLHVVGVHFEHSADLDLFVDLHVCEGAAFCQLALVDPDVGQLPEPVFLELEHVPHEFLVAVVCELEFDLLPAGRVDFVSVIFYFSWVRQVSHYCVQGQLHALVFVG
jgi:hypothetical protein